MKLLKGLGAKDRKEKKRKERADKTLKMLSEIICEKLKVLTSAKRIELKLHSKRRWPRKDLR